MSFKPASNKVQINTSDEMNNSLNELFNVVFDKSPCSQKPFNERHLPKSFFVPPSGSHISSAASHHKASSSPATLAETYRAGPGNNHINNHFKQHSLDSHNVNQQYTELGRVPDMDVKSLSPTIEASTQLSIEIKKLPLNYGMAVNENGQVYFLDHATKKTTWFDPRLPENIQKWGMTLSDLQELHIRYINMLPTRRASIQKQAASSQQQHLSQPHQTNTCPDSKSQIHFRSCSQPVSLFGASLDLERSCTTLSNFQAASGQPMAYFVHNSGSNKGAPIVNSYHEFCLLHPHDSSVQASQSQSNNSSCSNLSSCLNGLNLSPASQTSAHNSVNVMMVPKSYYGGGLAQQCHSHQDSLDSGVGQSLVSQTRLSTNFGSQNSDQNKGFDMLIKLEDCDSADNCFNDEQILDEYMDVDIRSPDY